jgi:N4-gp56 family major capsid protein
MAYPTPQVTNTTAAVFIPEIWSDEVIAAYKANLVAANLFKKMSFKGKKGDTIHIPKPTRGEASLKASETAVTLIAATETEVIVPIDKHYEYSRFIEDITEVQALSSMRRFYTDDAGYALAKQVDTDMVQLGRVMNGGTASNVYDAGYTGADGSTLYDGSNAAALTDIAIRNLIQKLDDQDVPTSGRFFLIPPAARNTLMGLDRYTAMDFVGEAASANTIRNGQIGNLYGIPVYVTSNADTATGTDRVCLMGHKDAAVLVEQLNVRSQTQYKQDYLSTLYTSDTIYGVKELREDSAFALVVPA